MEKLCEHCGEVFRFLPYRAATARFCSRSCTNKATISRRLPAQLEATLGRHPHNFAGVGIICQHCGKHFNISPSRLGKKRFCSAKCYAAAVRIDDGTRYNRITVDGRRVREHVWKMEQLIGRRLFSGEEVHHENAKKRDNRYSNLLLMDKPDHARETMRQRAIALSSSRV